MHNRLPSDSLTANSQIVITYYNCAICFIIASNKTSFKSRVTVMAILNFLSSFTCLHNSYRYIKFLVVVDTLQKSLLQYFYIGSQSSDQMKFLPVFCKDMHQSYFRKTCPLLSNCMGVNYRILIIIVIMIIIIIMIIIMSVYTLLQ